MELELNEEVNINEIVSEFDYLDLEEEDNFNEKMLQLNEEDVNNEVLIEADSGDEDLELDVAEDIASINVKLLPTPNQTNYLNKVFCVSQSYVIVETKFKKNTLCHYCYYIHQFFLQGGSHNHVNTHIKRSLKFSNLDIHCETCKRSLYLLMSPDVCLQCNSGNKNIEAYWDTNIPIVP